jgi:hypothetical protein
MVHQRMILGPLKLKRESHLMVTYSRPDRFAWFGEGEALPDRRIYHLYISSRTPHSRPPSCESTTASHITSTVNKVGSPCPNLVPSLLNPTTGQVRYNLWSSPFTIRVSVNVVPRNPQDNRWGEFWVPGAVKRLRPPQKNGMSVRLGHEENHGQMGVLDVGVCVSVSRLTLSISIKQEGIRMFPMLNSHNRWSAEGSINALPFHENTEVVTWSLRSHIRTRSGLTLHESIEVSKAAVRNFTRVKTISYVVLGWKTRRIMYKRK